ncbi:hypothetical protein C0Q70_17176 [Pomacea canaliculata]|uniref:Uncharacterized protein n=1 Tax=Pomacea canaliculata TaxID=400727 RepID=A0A2T7NRU5_POMCA|nr:hypothetical protein C0Q70_17176 [Pomacea canaliculata]
MTQGCLTPANKTYVPVGGWPTMGLEELVFNAMNHCLDPKNVKAGVDFTSQFMRVWNARLRRQKPPTEEETISKINMGDPDLVYRKERVRRDDILFLKTLKLLIEKLLQLKVRHLRSNVPINLENLDSHVFSKDIDVCIAPSKRFLGGFAATTHSFKEQIMSQAPYDLRKRKVDAPARMSINVNMRKIPSPRHHTLKNEHSPGETPSHVITPLDEKFNEMLRKPWPVIWQALAAADQGHNIGAPLPTPPVQAKVKNSLTNILTSRKEWATARKEISRAVDETLWRVDNETIESFHAQMGTLSNLSVSTIFKAHQRQMEAEVKRKRRQRQKRTIYDCELTAWYKELVDEMQKGNGKKDVEVNNLLESIKPYFKLSPSNPKFVKAKVALIVMSLPINQICQIHYQRAVTFLLDRVFKAPAGTLGHWLKTRGLPLVLP